jgi:hypothetical protein
MGYLAMKRLEWRFSSYLTERLNMARTAKSAVAGKAGSTPDGFINVPVTRATREGLHVLKDAMDVSSQAEVIEKLVAIGLAIQAVSRN